VPKHEHFEELCAAAGIGQATPQELLELERHASECDACRQAYFDYLDFASRQFAAAEQNPTLSPREAQESLSSELFAQRFFDRAGREGIVFSHDVGQEVKQLSVGSPRLSTRRAWWTQTRAVAAAMIIGVILSAGYFYAKDSFKRNEPASQIKSDDSARSEVSSIALSARIAGLTATNSALQPQLENLNSQLRKTSAQLATSETSLKATSQDRQRLQSDRDTLESQLTEIQRQVGQAQALAASAQQEAAKQHDHANDVEAAAIADRVKLNDLTDELAQESAALDQERQLLTVGHDVTDLMGARNLHIVDVVDTDPRGKTRPAFGRIFFTEGKSLIFYAYDLNETRIQKANYQYRVWAKQEGGDKQVRNLGIFYSDDKTQRRWVFKCNDPKILNEIDSVFVTLEPANSDPAHPEGPNLMYAYLHGQPNHP
jgi:hypothetical protein